MATHTPLHAPDGSPHGFHPQIRLQHRPQGDRDPVPAAGPVRGAPWAWRSRCSCACAWRGRTRSGPCSSTIFPVGFAGGPMTPEFYLAMLTMHGTIMVFFVLTTAPLSGFGNYFLPIQIGARDMAFPVLEHDVVLGHVRRLGGHGVRAVRHRRRAHLGLDRVRAAQRLGRGGRPGLGTGADALDHQHRDLLRRRRC